MVARTANYGCGEQPAEGQGAADEPLAALEGTADPLEEEEPPIPLACDPHARPHEKACSCGETCAGLCGGVQIGGRCVDGDAMRTGCVLDGRAAFSIASRIFAASAAGASFAVSADMNEARPIAHISLIVS